MERILIWVGGVCLLAWLLRIVSRKLEASKSNKAGERSDFYLRKVFMNVSEKEFFRRLLAQLGAEFIILSKVRIEDFIGVNRESLNFGEINSRRNRIKSSHVDFLILDLQTTRPLMAIELDGDSHNKASRKIRDQKFNQLYEEVGLKYWHVKVEADFESKIAEIKTQLKTSVSIKVNK